MGVDEMTSLISGRGSGSDWVEYSSFYLVSGNNFLLVRVGSTGEGVDVLNRDEGVPDREEGS